MADIDESESKPKILVFGGDEGLAGRLNKQEGMSFVFSNLEPHSHSDFKDCQRILLYPSSPLSRYPLGMLEDLFEDVIDLFEKNVPHLGGIEGVVLYVWADESDREEEMVERLRLEERGCVWGFGAGSDPKIAPIMDKFFNDNFQTNLKPAKREK